MAGGSTSRHCQEEPLCMRTRAPGDQTTRVRPHGTPFPERAAARRNSCGFRDHYAELRSLGASAVFGLSTQTIDYQREAVERLHLPFQLLSDSDLVLARALRLPTFEFEPYREESSTLLKRMALVIRDGRLEKVFYPVFPPDRNADDVIAWLRASAM